MLQETNKYIIKKLSEQILKLNCPNEKKLVSLSSLLVILYSICINIRSIVKERFPINICDKTRQV